MFYEKEKIDRMLCCSFCEQKFSDVVKLIPECGNSICAECHDGLRDKLETLPAVYTCKACGEEGHTFPAKGLPSIKNMMDLAKTAPSQRPLSEQAKKLRELVRRMTEEIRKLKSFNPEKIINEHFKKLDQQVNEAAESEIKHINQIRSDLLGKTKEHRQECLQSLLKRSSSIKQEETDGPPAEKIVRLISQLHATEEPPSKFQQEIGNLSTQASAFIRKWNGYFQTVDSYASDCEIATALSQVQAARDTIQKFEEVTKLEETRMIKIKFEDNNLFVQKRYNIGKVL